MYWSWILTAVGLAGFILAGRKVWWCWYINIACQGLWFTYAIVTDQYGFIVASIVYTVVFTQNAIRWTREHRQVTVGDTNKHPYVYFCTDCPDREACSTGWPCVAVRQVYRDS